MILFYPSDILKKRCNEVQKLDSVTQPWSLNTNDIISDMISELRESEGVGIAAPQIGSLQRIIVIDEHAGTNKSKLIVMINPKISKASKKLEEGIETCLSIPGRQFRVVRAKSVWISFMNSSGVQTRQFSSGLEARIIQHEIHHLDGITIADRGKEVL